MKSSFFLFNLLLFLFTFCHFVSIAQGNWSNPISLTNTASNNANANIQYLNFMEDDFYVFWEEATDTLASAINYKRFYGENELMTLRSEDGIHFKNPQLINTQKPSIDTNFIVLYEDDSKGYNDISLQFYTSEGFSTPASLTGSSFPKSDLMANFVGDIVWLEENKVMFMKYDVYNDSFSDAIVIDSGNCSFLSVKQTDGMWGWGGYPVLSWIKEENDSTYIKLKRQEFNGEWLDTESIFAGTVCTNLSFDGGFGFAELLSWDHYYDQAWHLKIYHTLEEEIMEMGVHPG